VFVSHLYHIINVLRTSSECASAVRNKASIFDLYALTETK